MDWFFYSAAALLLWSGSDVFSKIGCRDGDDRESHLKMLVAVGAVMGVHAASEIFIFDAVTDIKTLLYYLPVSLLYISSMLIGYLGLRYIELSVSSPICNSSGALVAVMTVLFFGAEGISAYQFAAVAAVIIAVTGLGVVEMTENAASRESRQKISGYFYKKSAAAIMIPVLYCVLDAAGTFADGIVLTKIDEDSANIAYELTFFICAAVAFIVLRHKKAKFTLRREVPKYIGAVFETAGQYFYIHALSDEEHIALAAPMISSYCLASVVWSRIFLKEKLSARHYILIAVAVIGIAVLGFFEEI